MLCDGNQINIWRFCFLAKFHRSIKPNSKFNFINVAVWENEEVYWTAYKQSVTPMKTKLEQLGVEMTPALYHVAFEY